jgi:hypothetical protein
MGYTMCARCSTAFAVIKANGLGPIVMNKEYATVGCSGKINRG